jgi:phosphoenolpyruvate synthase/pyruvate phosphate dikinase
MHETFANVIGDTAVLVRLVDCWASLYGERVISYLASRGLTAEPVIAVVVQQLVDADRAGVMFSADPSTGDRRRVVIEAAFGLGEAVVAVGVEPDTYVLAVREETPNLHPMIPFVPTTWELEACLDAVDASPLARQRGLHRWVMAEVPSVVYRMPEYAAMGIDGVSIASNDLTQVMLGVDRDPQVCAQLFDERAVGAAEQRLLLDAARDSRARGRG